MISAVCRFLGAAGKRGAAATPEPDQDEVCVSDHALPRFCAFNDATFNVATLLVCRTLWMNLLIRTPILAPRTSSKRTRYHSACYLAWLQPC